METEAESYEMCVAAVSRVLDQMTTESGIEERMRMAMQARRRIDEVWRVLLRAVRGEGAG